MNIEEYRDYCIRKPGVTESLPFDESTLVFKVMNKMFALADIDVFNSINLKCDPELAQEYRAKYPAIQPGYHMNKTHWNTVVLDGSLPEAFLYELIDHSYAMVVQSLPKKTQAELKALS